MHAALLRERQARFHDGYPHTLTPRRAPKAAPADGSARLRAGRMPRPSPRSPWAAGARRQPAGCSPGRVPSGVGYRSGIQPGNAGCHGLCVRADHDQYLRWRELPCQPHHAMYQGLALPGQKLLGLAKSGAPAGSQHDDRMRVSHLPCALRHCCSCAAMLSEIASGPRPPMSRPTGDRSLGKGGGADPVSAA